MKELSIEEKAQRYDEAIKRAKGVIEQNPLMEYLKKGIECIFPELKESEDEKIRKAIHIYLDWLDGRKDYAPKGEYTIRDMIAWLENQGEQKPTGFDDANAKRMFIKALERVEEQNNKGYKLTDCDKNSWWEDFKTYCGYIEIQKPAWSEDDELIVAKILCICDDFERSFECSPSSTKVIKEDVDKIDTWLKSLKDRVQPKQEWSEEDEMFVHGLIRGLTAKRDIHGHTTFSSDNIDITKTIDWLKSLRERYTWKPSDEQIKVCKEVYADILSAKGFDLGTVNSELNRMEEELKKLREE